MTLHFTITDTGIGIPAEKQKLIFEPFTQADTSTTRRYGGSGLGLSISARLIEMMRGRIWLESEVGKGTTFHFTARVRSGDSDDIQRRPAPTQRFSTNMRVLVVDDNATNRQILEKILTHWRMSPPQWTARKRRWLLKQAKEAKDPFRSDACRPPHAGGGRFHAGGADSEDS